MTASLIFLIVLALATVGFVLGRHRASVSAGGDRRVLHSLPNYYGFNVALWALIPALLLLGAWLILQPPVIEARVKSVIPAARNSSGQ